MIKLKKTMDLDKNLLVDRIRDAFQKSAQLKYQRALFEFFNDQTQFVGDNLLETTFRLREGHAPIVYEVSGPYDVVSKEYATIARVYHRGELVYEFDMKPGILQRTAAMVWIYLDSLKHPLGKILFIGAGKVALHTATYLKHFSPDLKTIDYTDLNQKNESFEIPLGKIGIQTNFMEVPDFSLYDTIILATTTTTCLIHEGNISTLSPGAVIISLCTTSQSGEISEEVYGRSDINTFLDYEGSKTFTADMKRANDLGYLEKAILYSEILEGNSDFDLHSKINIVRLTGTPMQNVAVIDMMLEEENVDY